ncbi:hypothetical protein BN871_AT_00020 [Paenibacillus sp. P22]|nr:hypothetical protein BN871_AT_00020 [Paenibacillus sp. P22]
MGDDDDGQAQLAVEPPENVHDEVGGAAVDGARRLVGEQHLRPVGQRDGDRHPLLLASRELMQLVVHPLLQPDPIQQLLGIGPVDLAGEHHRHLDIFQSGQIRQQVAGIVLPDEADRIPLVFDELVVRHLEQIPRPDLDAARRRAVESAQNVEQGRLAAAAVADDRHQLAVLNAQVQALQGDDLQIVRFVDFDQAFAFDHDAITAPLPS